MRELGEALRLLFGKLSEFLDVFDLSFLVAGGAALGALLYAGGALFRAPPAPSEAALLLLGLALLLAAYVCGLVCFAAGRGLRRTLTRRGDADAPAFEVQRLGPAVRQHGLDRDERFAGYVQGDGRVDRRLYLRLWAELRHDPLRVASLRRLDHHWTLAATYDGLTIAALFWLLALVGRAALGPGPPPLPPAATLGLGAFALLAAFVCAIEARRHQDNQVEELAASIAAVPPPPLVAYAPSWEGRDPAALREGLPPLGALRR